MKKLVYLFTAIIFSALFGFSADAAVKVSKKSGPYGFASTWTDNIAPVAGDDIIIQPEHGVYDVYATVNNLTVRGSFQVRDFTALGSVIVEEGGSIGSLSGGYNSKFKGGLIVNNGTISNGTNINGDSEQAIAGTGVWLGGIEYRGGGTKTINALYSKSSNTVYAHVIVGGVWEVTNGGINKLDTGTVGNGGGWIVFKGNGLVSSNESLGNLFTAPIFVESGSRGVGAGSISGNLTIKSGASCGPSNVTSNFKGDVTVELGAILNGRDTILSGTNIHNDGLINSGTLSFRGGDQAISGGGEWKTPNGVEIEGSGVKSLLNSISMDVGGLGIDSALNINEHTLTFDGGNFAKRPTGRFMGNGKIVFTGNGVISSNESSGNLFEPAIEINGSRSFNSSSSVSGAVTIKSGAVMSTHLKITAHLKNDFTIESDATAKGENISFSGENIVNNGTISPIVFNFTREGNQTISGSGVWKSSNGVNLNGSGTKYLLSDMNIQIVGGFNVNSIFDIGSNTVNFTKATFNKQPTGTVSGNGTIKFFGDGTLNSRYGAGNDFNAPVEIVTGRRGSGATSVLNCPVLVRSGATLGIGAHTEMSIHNDLTLENGARIEGQTLSLYNQNFVNNGVVTPVNTIFRSGTHYLSGTTGSFGGNGTEMQSGSATVLNGIQQFGNLTLRAGSSFDITNSTLKIAGVLGNSGTMTTDGSTVEYNRAGGDQTVVTNIAYHNLTINNPRRVFLNSAETVENILRLEQGTFEIYTNRLTIGDCGQIIRVGGVLNGTPVFATGCNGVIYEGTLAMTTGTELPDTVGLLAVNNAEAVTLNKNVTVTGLLNLFTDLITNDFIVTMPPDAVSSGAGDVIGNVRRTGILNDTDYSFGNPNNRLRFVSGIPPAEITFNLVKFPPDDLTNAITRTYNITSLGGNNYTATLRLHYKDDELNGNAEEQLNFFQRGDEWMPVSATDRNTEENWLETTGVSSFSSWTMGNSILPPPEFTISGRVITADKTAVYPAVVYLTAPNGEVRTAQVNKSGYYRFEKIEAGQTYILNAYAESRQFQPLVQTANEKITGLNFIGIE